MNTSLLQQMLDQKYVRVNKHPTEELYIYNYTPTAQYERVWNEVTLQCRGLILDQDYNYVARPFPKFFNLGEFEDQHIPNLPFEVYEKMDGSLGITYWVDGKVQIATRGSFTSHQAIKAMQLLDEKYPAAKEALDPMITYLFEIIYPENKIVVEYGQEESLTLLAMIDTQTGEELSLVDIGIPLVKKYENLDNIHRLSELEEDNREGFVIKFSNNYRLKVKFEEYVRLHRIITNVSSISIWEYLRTGQSLDEVLQEVPDEFYDWVKKVKTDLENQYLAIEEKAKSEFKTLSTRKETAIYFNECTYPGILFSLLDKKDYSDKIWLMVRPEFKKPTAGQFLNSETPEQNRDLKA